MRLTKQLPCALTVEERSEKAEELVNRIGKTEEIRADAEAAKNRFKKQLGAEEDQIEKLCSIIRNNEESRNVECAIIPLHSAFAMVTVRLDTGAEVSRRAMTDAERSPKLIADDDDIPDEEKQQNERLTKLLELVDSLKSVDVILKLEDFAFTIQDAEIDEIRKWVGENIDKAEIGDRSAPPASLQHVLETVAANEEQAREREELTQTVLKLVDELKIPIDEIVVRSWGEDELQAVHDYAQAFLSNQQDAEVVVPERPTCLPAPTAPSEPDGKTKAAGSD